MLEQIVHSEHKLRSLLAKLLPASTTIALYSSTRSSFLQRLARAEPVASTPEHPTHCLGLTFRNDLGNAAGLDKDGSLLAFNYALGAGFAIVGTVLDEPHTGNLISAWGQPCNPWTPLPASASALNSLGLPSKGVDVALDEIKRFQDQQQASDFPIGLSIMGHPEQSGERKLSGVLTCIEKAAPVVDFIEVNESCPNVHGHDSDQLAARLQAVVQCRDAASKQPPILVKLADFGDPTATLDVMLACGVDGLSAVNTQKDYPRFLPALHQADHALFRHYTEHHGGGLSGPLIRSFALEQLTAMKSAIEARDATLTLVHVGGIAEPEDLAASRELAPLRQWYTGLMTALGNHPWSQVYPRMFGPAGV